MKGRGIRRIEKKNVEMNMQTVNGQNHHISHEPKNQGPTRIAIQANTKPAQARIVSRKSITLSTHPFRHGCMPWRHAVDPLWLKPLQGEEPLVARELMKSPLWRG